MPDSLTNIELPMNEWVDLYALTGITVGAALSVENVGVCDVYLTVQATQPDVDHKAYNVIRRENGFQLKNTVGDSGAWAYCNAEKGLINVAPTDDGGFYASLMKRIITDASGNEMTLEPNGSLPVTLQDQVSPSFLVKANRVTAQTTLLNAAAFNDRDIVVTDITGILVGDYLGIFNEVSDRYYVGNVVTITPGAGVTGTLRMDRVLDSAFSAGDLVGTGTTNLASLPGDPDTPIIYTVRGADPGVDITIDITRIVITCLTTDAIDLASFGDQDALTYGLFVRNTNGTTHNIDCWKSNLEMMGTMYDFDSLEDQGVGLADHGFKGRFTAGGQSKLGMVWRIGPGESLEFWVQDPQVADLLLLEIKCEGSEVV